MGLEVANFIADLTPAWPLSTDKIREGDDHLRAIKTAVKNSFPNIDAAVTATPEQLNALPDDTAAEVAEIIQHLVPAGIITAFSGAEEDIPTGWALCDGTNGTPDLRGKFIIGAGGDYEVDDEGGAETATSEPTELTVEIAGTALDLTQIPSHYHFEVADVIAADAPSGVNYLARETAAGGDTEYNLKGTGTAPTILRSSSAGGGQEHTHDITGSTEHTHAVSVLPPYYALCWIMKLASYAAP